jgi:hypothetical protein
VEIHPILTPVPPVLHEVELLLEERMVWMNYLKALLRIDSMCS